jgi:hypothetical protein
MCGTSVQESVNAAISNDLSVAWCFPSSVYTIKRPDFLETVSQAADEALKNNAKIIPEVHSIYPVRQTDNLIQDIRMADFISYTANTAWNILENNGYAIQNFGISVMEMWCQEHFKGSGMDEHVHGAGAQIVGFYFLETPEDCSRAIFHDPRIGKKQIGFPEKNLETVTPASGMINFKPEPGLLVFSEAWLPHSFTRHGSDKPIKFIHFTLGVVYKPSESCSLPPAAEVI